MLTTYAHWLHILSQIARDKEGDWAARLRQEGLGFLMDAAGADQRLSIAHTKKMWTIAESMNPDPALGLLLLRGLNFLDFGQLGVVMAGGGSLHELLTRMVRFSPLISEAITLSYTRQSGGESILRIVRSPEAHWRSEECAAAAVVRGLRSAMGAQFHPQRVSFAFDNPAAKKAYERYFSASITWKAPHTELCFAALPVEKIARIHPMSPALLSLEQVLQEQLNRQRSRLTVGGKWAMRVQQRLQGTRLEEMTSVTQMADLLHISSRSLQRHLKEEGVSFTQILDAMRRERAQAWIDQVAEMRDISSIAQLAEVLGFSGQAALNKAFQRWFACAPNEARIEKIFNKINNL